MKYVGYIAGRTLEALQEQWCELLDAEADVILFDRTFLGSGARHGNGPPSLAERDKMWRYAETMLAGQDVTGNSGNYQTLHDLIPGDRVVITDLQVLHDSTKGIWNDLLRLHQNGVGLVVVRKRFDSSGPFGEDVLEMMNSLYELGRSE